MIAEAPFKHCSICRGTRGKLVRMTAEKLVIEEDFVFITVVCQKCKHTVEVSFAASELLAVHRMPWHEATRQRRQTLRRRET